MGISYRSRIFSAILSISTIVACSGNIEPENGDNGNDVHGGNGQNVELNVNYKKQSIVFDFTSTGCHNCPSLAKGLEELSKEKPGVFTTVAMHTNYAMISDPMYLPMTDTMMKKFGVKGLPSAVVNFITDADKIFSLSSKIADLIDQEQTIKPNCGVALSTTYDSATGGIVVETKITSNVSKMYRYMVILTESGISADQAGVDGAYTHNHVARAFLTTNVNGDRVNLSKPLEPGKEYIQTKKATLAKGFAIDKMTVIAIALSSSDNGVNWSFENLRECKLGESADYQIIK